MCSETSGIRRFYDSPVESAAEPRATGRCLCGAVTLRGARAVARHRPLPLHRVPALERHRSGSVRRRARRRPGDQRTTPCGGSRAPTPDATHGADSASTAARACSGRPPSSSGPASPQARSTLRPACASRLTSTRIRRWTGTSSPTTDFPAIRRRVRSRSAGPRGSCCELGTGATRGRSYTRPPDRSRHTAPRALRLRRLPSRAGGRRARGDRGTRHARAHADRLGQVAHVSARRDAPAGADARPVSADRAHEGPGGQAAAADRGDGDLRQLVAERGGDRRAARRRLRRRDASRLRGTGAPEAVALRRAPRERRHRARGRGRGALREHVGPRLPARLPLHPSRPRGPRSTRRSSA